MEKVIKNSIQSMSWRAKSSLVALLTLATTVLMYEGWYNPETTLGASPATITDCGGCHFYPATAKLPADGTSRHNPPGYFPGNHATHSNEYAYACTVCHKDNTAYSHSDGFINLTGSRLSGSAYNNGAYAADHRKALSFASTPTLYACNNTYCHSNGTSVATGAVQANASPAWGAAAGSLTCNGCHGAGGPTTGAPNYANLKRVPTTQSGASWTTPANALAEDGAYATYAGTAQSTLILTNFGYTTSHVADTDTVTGISVVVKGWAASGTTPGNQLSVQLTQNGSAGVGTAKAISLPGTTAAANGYVFCTTTTADLWGTTWTPAQIRATTFGVILKDNDTANSQLNVDVVKVIVHTNKSPKMNSHASHSSYTCDRCHSAVVNASNAIIDVALHVNNAYNIDASKGYTYSARGSSCSTSGCHGTAYWGASTLGCTACHSTAITRTLGAPGKVIQSVVAEFGQAWSHKRSAGGAVTDADCIVCHLEGDSTTGKTSAIFHNDANGYIDLRDPDGAATETPITNISGGPFSFKRFSTSYAAGTRTTTGHTANTIDNVITQKFCLKCHDANGATNPGARVGGAATSQYKPFNTTISGAGYVTPLSAGVAGGVVNVFRQFSSGNSSIHPVRAPRNKDYPTPAKLNAPYNNFTRTAGTKANGIVLNCFDCHNVVGIPLTTRTVAAHGNAVTIRGISVLAAGATPAAGTNETTLCKVCHYQYDTQTQANHGTGSASGNLQRSEKIPYMRWGCTRCHSSGYLTAVARPKRGEDVHGFNSSWTTPARRQTAFIRNTDTLQSHQPRMIGTTSYTPQCVGMFGDSACDESAPSGRTESYSPGGAY